MTDKAGFRGNGRPDAPPHTGRKAIRYAAYLAGLLGLALLGYLVIDAGAEDVAQAVLLIGWGLAAITAYRLVPMLASTASWREMLPAARRPGFGILLWARWIREGINNLLPVAQVGGDLAAARLIHQRGAPGAYALGSTLVDITVGVVTQMAFLALGIAVLLFFSSTSETLSLITTILIGMGVMMGAIGLFFLLQQKGMMGFGARVAGALMRAPEAESLAAGAGDTDAAIRNIYRSGPAFLRALAWRFLTWLLGAGEVWLILHFMGHPVGLAEALVLESFGAAVRSAAFLVPGGIGVVEASFVLFGALFGLSATDSLALALGKRVREIALGLPGLASWQIAEARRLFRKSENS